MKVLIEYRKQNYKPKFNEILKDLIENNKKQKKLEKQRVLELMNRQNKVEEQKELEFMSSSVTQECWEFLKEVEKASEFQMAMIESVENRF